MKSCRALLVAASCLAGIPGLALGPVDGEIGAVWWSQDVKTDAGSADADGPGFRAELWMADRYGLHADAFSSEVDEMSDGDSNSMSLDVLWRPWSPAENTFVAVGLGWQTMDLAAAGVDDSTSGARLALEGRVGLLGQVYAFGRAAYLPALDDASSSVVAFEDLKATQLEAGVSWRLAPFISVQGGYRMTNLDFEQTTISASPAMAATGSQPGGDGGASGAAVGVTELIPVTRGSAPGGISSSSAGGSADTHGVFAGMTFHF